MSQAAVRRPVAGRFLRPWSAVLVVGLLYLAAVFFSHGSNALTFVTLGTRYAERDSTGTEGYDGQFAYFIARDGWEAASLLDVPAYRFQRILLPALAGALSFGNTALLPWLLPGLNLIALVAGTALLEELLAARGVSRWYALVYGLFPGVLMAVRLSLNEPLAYGLILLAIRLRGRERLWQAAAACALAALAKETALVFVAGFVLWELASRRWAAGLLFGLLACLPFVAWQAVLVARLGAPGVGSGGDLATPFEISPSTTSCASTPTPATCACSSCSPSCCCRRPSGQPCGPCGARCAMWRAETGRLRSFSSWPMPPCCPSCRSARTASRWELCASW